MNKTLTVVKDLRSIIEYVAKNVASITFHPQCKSNGNVWAIRGPKKNVIVMLYYQNKSKFTDENFCIKQEPDENFLMDAKIKATDLEHEVTKSCRDGQHIISRMDKPLTLLEDLRNTVDCIERTIASVLFHPRHQRNESIWVIQIPGKNVVVMLHYENETELADKDCIVDATCVKLEPDENFTMDTQCVATNLNIKFLDASTIITEEVQSILPDIEVPCQSVQESMKRKQSLGEGSTLDMFSSIAMNVLNDFRYSQCYDSGFKDDIIVPDVTIHDGFACGFNCKAVHGDSNKDHVQELVQTCLEEPTTCVELDCERTVIDEEATSLLLSNESKHSCVSSSSCESMDAPNYKHQDMDSLHQSVFDTMRTMKLKECSVLLKPLDISCLKNNGKQKQEKQENQGDKAYQCSLCDKKFCLKSEIQEHELIHSKEKPFKCSQCKKRYCTKFNLEQHKRIHSGERPFECSLCNKTFSLKSCLNVHLRVHSGEKRVQCSVCDMTLYDNRLLEQHMLIHSGEKPFECSLCKKKFRLKSGLDTHRRVHSGEKPFVCSVCGMAFSQNTSLNRHKLLHSGERPYECLECGKKFSTKNTLNRHKAVHSEEKPYECSLCGKTFSQKRTLKQHTLIHSSDET